MKKNINLVQLKMCHPFLITSWVTQLCLHKFKVVLITNHFYQEINMCLILLKNIMYSLIIYKTKIYYIHMLIRRIDFVNRWIT